MNDADYAAMWERIEFNVLCVEWLTLALFVALIWVLAWFIGTLLGRFSRRYLLRGQNQQSKAKPRAVQDYYTNHGPLVRCELEGDLSTLWIIKDPKDPRKGAVCAPMPARSVERLGGYIIEELMGGEKR